MRKGAAVERYCPPPLMSAPAHRSSRRRLVITTARTDRRRRRSAGRPAPMPLDDPGGQGVVGLGAVEGDQGHAVLLRRTIHLHAWSHCQIHSGNNAASIPRTASLPVPMATRGQLLIANTSSSKNRQFPRRRPRVGTFQ